jgi:hypothetical protein
MRAARQAPLNHVRESPLLIVVIDPCDERLIPCMPTEDPSASNLPIGSEAIQPMKLFSSRSCSRPRLLAIGATISSALLLSACAPQQTPESVFDFERLALDGEVYQGNGDFLREPWACVRDRRTGLVWEVKTTEPGLRFVANTYTWYFPDGHHRGNPGTADGGECIGSACDTEGFVAAVNEQGLCGHHDWRVPSKEELGSIVDPRHPRNRRPGAATASDYFPDTLLAEYWSSSTYAYHAPGAWGWGFQYGLDRVDLKSNPKHIRLVRGEVRMADAETETETP